MALLEITDLRTHFHTPSGVVRAVNGLSLKVEADETVAIVGESGSGKSVMSLSVLRLLASPPARITGSVKFQGVELLNLSNRQMREVRGNDISMVFQEPMTSLNPVLTIGWQITETLKRHQRLGAADARKRAIELLKIVGIPSPERRIDDYPYQFSGGMRQRAMIAIALACSPKLLIADEPTTALDVTIQAQVLDLMRQMKKQFRSAIMLITHDLGVVAEMADRVVIMYAGSAVEMADVKSIFRNPRHRYTRGLLGSIPRLGASLARTSRQPLNEIRGQVPSLREEIRGCAFAPRCAHATGICHETAPAIAEAAPAHFVACHHPAETGLLEGAT